MKPRIFIPTRLNVGFQKRVGTYNGKLAYVIHYDKAGKLRKEVSWNKWRDHDIPNEEFDNEPTSGFVLNKKAGDYKSGWNHRQAYCRVYDPRGFEFEITIENLLFILENCNCIKGKGLEGDFVYGWDGAELLLLPVDSQEYKDIVDYEEKAKNIDTLKLKDIQVGKEYIDKDDKTYIYMGKHPYYKNGYVYRDASNNIVEVLDAKNIPDDIVNSSAYESKAGIFCGEYLWFAQTDTGMYKDSVYFEQYKGMPRRFIAYKSDITSDKKYEMALKCMRQSPSFSPIDRTKTKYIQYTLDYFRHIVEYNKSNTYDRLDWFFGCTMCSDNGFLYNVKRCRKDKELFTVNLECDHSNLSMRVEDRKVFNTDSRLNGSLDEHTKDFNRRFNVVKVVKREQSYLRPEIAEYTTTEMDIQELFERLKPSYAEVYLENGELYTTRVELK